MRKSEIASIQVKGLKCDNPKCDYIDMSIPYEAYKSFIGTKCPKCGCVLLTEADYKTVQKGMKIVAFLNKVASYFPGLAKEDEMVSFQGQMNGTGKVKFIKNDIKK